MSVNVQKQSLFKRAFLQTEFKVACYPKIELNASKEEAWQILKQPQNGFERFALRFISKQYIVPRKPFVLSEVMKQICNEWSSFDQDTKYYYCNQ
ncbi:unnamed protein product (macronuclear) [Paramecium tetraurelia]|uniref:HMG box domain-containing protein n=1 Tax=Paramecium tetraurelia TaxID=5888 RepID=A0C8D1_PARTE|nr:uncharacterized protein GSPATT00036181001 [Paramecium tetraurelia]CAK67048.1 unnamed protein product [Paramecium tetraurelia]|eukprot:XP_001434445.1 hypothetical protein (macronuclear) [Paramecium tetraurelia strain d4-2]